LRASAAQTPREDFSAGGVFTREEQSQKEQLLMVESRPSGARGRRTTIMSVAAVAGFVAALLAAVALASTAHTVKTAHNAQLGKTILVDSHGATLYELKTETAHHLLCANQSCLGLWPPLKTTKTAKLTKPSGVKGKLGRIHRKGFWQVTLGGVPLYHFAADHGKKGSVFGNGIHFSPTATWHVVSEHGTSKSPNTTTSTSTSTTSTYCLYPPCG
jgi:predicted lipoprotein with Yx(FWY)xxD motif